METARLRQILDDPAAGADWLESLRLADPRRAHANLVRMALCGLPLDLLGVICDQLGTSLPSSPDPDMALNNLESLLGAARSPLAVGTLFQRDPQALPILVQIFSTSQHLSELLIADPESFDLLRLTEGAPVDRAALRDDIASEVAALEHDQAVLRALRRFKRRETLRIAYGDIVREHHLRSVTAQISYLADALCEAALQSAWKRLAQQRGAPQADDRPARLVVLALGKLGGEELNYSSDIDLVFLYDADGKTDGPRPISNREFFERVARDFVRLLSEGTDLGTVYRIDLRLRPDGQRGPIVSSLAGALGYYDLRGRTWERQALIKARPVAGDLDLGREFLDRLTPWIYRRYLSRADISGIRALKRRIEERARQNAGQRDVKTGHGGIRDVEFVIQFLQLLNGGDLPAVRTGNTLEALARLEEVGCLSYQEHAILESNYRFLRKIEHRLQILFDLQTHVLPAQPEELRKLALRMGYQDTAQSSALAAFEVDFQDRTDLNRRILDHLLHDAFSEDADAAAEADLVLDPDPPAEKVAAVLGKYPFRDVKQAYRTLMSLAEERIRFLSTRRCRQFLAAIAPQLLQAVAQTPDPDSTLVHLDRVSASLGGKGVLWELFSFNPPSLRLYVELCAYSAYLSGILVSNPGMIDGLMDSLVLDKLPSLDLLRRTLDELCRGAEDLDPILHSFKNDQQLCVGVRDILGKEDVLATTGALSDIAEACLGQIAHREMERLVARFGWPTVADGPRRGQVCEGLILAMGKLGGREMNYHSDLDIIFLYEADGATEHAQHSGRGETTTNQHFFSEWGQRIIKTSSRLGPLGRLYEVDARLRPTGKSGALATSMAELARYFQEGGGQLWERQALCKARVLAGSPRIAQAAVETVGQAAFHHRWLRRDAEEIRQMRRRMEEAAAAGDLKRGPGGLVDVEFLVQMLQLKHGRRELVVRRPNTLGALAALEQAGRLSAADGSFLAESYRFLRRLEGRLRLMNVTARDRLPEEPIEQDKLAHLMQSPDRHALLAELDRTTREVRRRFERIFNKETGS